MSTRNQIDRCSSGHGHGDIFEINRCSSGHDDVFKIDRCSSGHGDVFEALIRNRLLDKLLSEVDPFFNNYLLIQKSFSSFFLFVYAFAYSEYILDTLIFF